MANEERTRLIVVYDSERDARAAADVARHAGADPRQIHIGDALDRVASIEGEMREEMAPNPATPGNVGGWIKEMAKAITVGALAGGVIGAVLALPFAAIGFGGMALWARLLTVAIVGAVCGSTAGVVIAGGFAPARPGERLAAEQGITLEVPATPAIEAALKDTAPRRLDVVDTTGRPLRTVTTRPREHIVPKLRRHAAEEERQG